MDWSELRSQERERERERERELETLLHCLSALKTLVAEPPKLLSFNFKTFLVVCRAQLEKIIFLLQNFLAFGTGIKWFC